MLKFILIITLTLLAISATAQTKDSITFSMYDACNAGKKDAHFYHKRGAGNMMLGLGFGIIGVIGAAAGEPKLPSPLITKRDEKMMMNPYYLECYRKRAKGKNVENAVLGMLLGVAAAGVIILTTSY